MREELDASPTNVFMVTSHMFRYVAPGSQWKFDPNNTSEHMAGDNEGFC